MCIELSFAARRVESSGGSSLHKAKASSKSPDAVNCTICTPRDSKEREKAIANQKGILGHIKNNKEWSRSKYEIF